MSTMAGFVAAGSSSQGSRAAISTSSSRRIADPRRPRAASRPGIPWARARGPTVLGVLTVLDGHTDPLPRDDAARFTGGRAGGHIDLPRARAGGLGGGIFACYTATPGAPEGLLADATPGGYFIGVSEPIGEAVAAPHAARTFGRLLTLERAGHVRVVRAIDDL